MRRAKNCLGFKNDFDINGDRSDTVSKQMLL